MSSSATLFLIRIPTRKEMVQLSQTLTEIAVPGFGRVQYRPRKKTRQGNHVTFKLELDNRDRVDLIQVVASNFQRFAQVRLSKGSLMCMLDISDVDDRKVKGYTDHAVDDFLKALKREAELLTNATTSPSVMPSRRRTKRSSSYVNRRTRRATRA